MNNKVVIILKGGVVQSVYAQDDVEIKILDRDMDCSDYEELEEYIKQNQNIEHEIKNMIKVY